jgi:hypothetical protein
MRRRKSKMGIVREKEKIEEERRAGNEKREREKVQKRIGKY